MASNVFVEKYGTPRVWQCPDCGVWFTIYPELPFNHLCGAKIRQKPKPAFYFMRLDTNGSAVEFCVVGGGDPNQWVDCIMPDGSTVRWEKREREGMTVFIAPTGYDVTLGVGWRYDPRFQYKVPAPADVQERYALRNRVSA